MSKLTERILLLKFVGVLKFVKISEFWEFLKFIKFEFSIYANTYSRQHVNATADKQWPAKFRWLENAHSRPIFCRVILTRKAVGTDLILVCDQGSLVGVRTQDYKSLCAMVTICAMLPHNRP